MDVSYANQSKLRAKISKKNLALSICLDRMTKRNPNLKVRQLCYAYGDFIIQNGRFLKEAPRSEKPAFALIMKGSVEIFTEKENYENKITTIAMLKPGNLLFLKPELDVCMHPISNQNATSGTRSIFLLPKIGNSDRFWRMARRNNIPLDLPSSLFDQWRIFKSLTASQSSTWQTEIILFGEEWLQQENSDILKQCLLYQTIPTRFLNSSKQEIDSVVDHLIEERTEIYSGQILKNVLKIASGDLPGFILPDDETFAPIKLIQKAFIEDYGLKTAELIHPGYVQPQSECFYSVEIHDQVQPSMSKNKHSSISALQETQKLYHRLLDHKSNHKLWSTLEQYEQVKLEFLHSFANTPIDNEYSQPQSRPHLYAPFIRKGCISIGSGLENYVTH